MQQTAETAFLCQVRC